MKDTCLRCNAVHENVDMAYDGLCEPCESHLIGQGVDPFLAYVSSNDTLPEPYYHVAECRGCGQKYGFRFTAPIAVGYTNDMHCGTCGSVEPHTVVHADWRSSQG